VAQGGRKRYGDQEISQFNGAELIAHRWDVSREDMEEFALRSHQRAVNATDQRLFEEEIVPLAGLKDDEGPRRDTSLAKMALLPVLREGGRLTAAVSSQVSDGASAVFVASERAVREHGLTPLARVHTAVVVGSDPPS